MDRKASQDLVTGAVVAAISLLLFWYAGQFPDGASGFPQSILGLTTILGLWLAVRQFVRPSPSGETKKIVLHWRYLAVIVLGSSAYFWSAGVVGYLTMTAIFVPVISWALGFRNLRYLAGTTVIYLVVSYLLFVQGLGINLPPEPFLKLIGLNG